MDRPVTFAQLSIVDGAWQEAPDNVAVVEQPGRGTLYLVCEVAGEPDGRDALARDLIETARREYTASRGSVALALTQALRAANDSFYNFNAGSPREARRIAGLTLAVLRENELFIAQGGPGLTCLIRGFTLQRYPEQSPWFEPEELVGEFPTPGAVPLGLRHDYVPDVFHTTLVPGDIVLLATRSLAHLLTDEELLDTVARRHPDEIVESLEDIAGSTDLSAIALQLPSDELAPMPAPSEDEPEPEPVSEVPPRTERARPNINVMPALLAALAGITGGLARMVGSVEWARIGMGLEIVLTTVARGLIALVTLAVKVFLPGEPQDSKHLTLKPRTPNLQTAWRLAALIFPLLLILFGGSAWINYRQEVERKTSAQIQDAVTLARSKIQEGRTLAPTNKNDARARFQEAVKLAQQALDLSPANQAARTAYNDARDELDKLDGVSLVYSLFKFATYSDGNASPRRIVAHDKDIFVLDRGTQRIYHYTLVEAGPAVTPTPNDGIILKAGDKAQERTVTEIIDILWIDAGRLVALDRSGLFLQYDPTRGQWTARAASDGAQWKSVTMAATWSGNLYLLDPTNNQILRYAAGAEGVWSAATKYFVSNAPADLSIAVDMAIDGDVWVLRANGTVWRFNQGNLVNFNLPTLDKPLAKPTALVTADKMNGLYIADAGNQRIVQLDKATNRYARQFRPKAEAPDAMSALKTLTVDEANRRFFFINGNQAFVATIPQ